MHQASPEREAGASKGGAFTLPAKYTEYGLLLGQGTVKGGGDSNIFVAYAKELQDHPLPMKCAQLCPVFALLLDGHTPPNESYNSARIYSR